MTTPEGIVEHAVFRYLRMRQIFAVKIKSMGTYDAKIKRYRSPGANYRKGVPDILAIINGKAVGIEVKSATGRLSPEQKQMQHEWAQAGGVPMVVRSVEELHERLVHFGLVS